MPLFKIKKVKHKRGGGWEEEAGKSPQNGKENKSSKR